MPKQRRSWRKPQHGAEFNDAARLQTILEKLPSIIESSAPVFAAIAAPLGNIDKVVMIDQGGNGHGNGDSHASGINRFAQTTPTLIFSVLQQLESLGLNIPDIMAQLGIEKDGSTAKPVTKPATPAPKAPTVTPPPPAPRPDSLPPKTD